MTIKQQQNLLQYLGYYTGIPDGDWGPLSRAACEKFQRDFGGLAVTGEANAETEKALRHAVAYGMPERDTSEEASGGTARDFWGKIKYFKRAEFACPCPRCGGFPVEPDETLVELADDVREHFGQPMTVSSGVRCQAHNDELSGSVKNSRHVRGKALDFAVKGKTAAQILGYVNEHVSVRYAYAIDDRYVHMDVE